MRRITPDYSANSSAAELAQCHGRMVCSSDEPR